jgi:hypothetical protein
VPSGDPLGLDELLTAFTGRGFRMAFSVQTRAYVDKVQREVNAVGYLDPAAR